MQPDDVREISRLIAAWGGGDQDALTALMPLVYPELRRIARRHLAGKQGPQSLESAALANEAYLKLAHAGGIPCENRVHFLALCSQIIRHILIDHVRNRAYAKRGGEVVHIPLQEDVASARTRGVEILALDRALESLSRIDARKSRVVELRYFGELTVEEAAQALGISVETAKRDWKMAKAWLFRTLGGEKARYGRPPG